MAFEIFRDFDLTHSSTFQTKAAAERFVRVEDVDELREALAFAKKENLSVDEMDHILNKESGVLGISGVSSDFRDIEAAEGEGNERATSALDLFAYRVAKTIGEYVTAMKGVDAIVFTAGLGENSATMRQVICDYLRYLGIELDSYSNSQRGKAIEITTKQSRVQVFVIPTNEELVIARDTRDIVNGLNK